MKISVIIPVFNPGSVFAECLSALEKSSLLPNELILVDDCSNPEIPEPSLKGIPVKTIRSEIPLGAGVARNLGVSHADGQILLFIDSDVIIAENVISLVADRFKADQELSAVSGFYDYQNRFNNLASIYNNLYFEYKQSHIQPETPYADTAIWAVKKEVFIQSGGFPAGLYSAEDLELAVKLDCLGYNLQTDRNIRVTHVKHLFFKGWIKNRITASVNMFMARLKRPAYGKKVQDRDSGSPLLATILPAQIISPFIAWGLVLNLILLFITKEAFFVNIFSILVLLYFIINWSYFRFIVKRMKFTSILFLPYVFIEHLITIISGLLASVRVIFNRPYFLYRRVRNE